MIRKKSFRKNERFPNSVFSGRIADRIEIVWVRTRNTERWYLYSATGATPCAPCSGCDAINWNADEVQRRRGAARGGALMGRAMEGAV